MLLFCFVLRLIWQTNIQTFETTYSDCEGHRTRARAGLSQRANGDKLAFVHRIGLLFLNSPTGRNLTGGDLFKFKSLLPSLSLSLPLSLNFTFPLSLSLPSFFPPACTLPFYHKDPSPLFVTLAFKPSQQTQTKPKKWTHGSRPAPRRRRRGVRTRSATSSRPTVLSASSCARHKLVQTSAQRCSETCAMQTTMRRRKPKP